MKRKKWSEAEELCLLSKYSDLLCSGALGKLRTREKKFRPIADHVNSLHHLSDPIAFPFRWSWRDVSVKVQNMRHQYLGVKQKIRLSDGRFNWSDGDHLWDNFLKYKEVFGDLDLPPPPPDHHPNKTSDDDDDDDVLGLGLGFEEDETLAAVDGGFVDAKESRDDRGCAEMGSSRRKKPRKGLVGARVLELRDAMVRREERRREREWDRERREEEREEARRDAEARREARRMEWEEEAERRELELEERRMAWVRREWERRERLERELEEERRRRIWLEEKREEEEMLWRERMVGLQIEHEKQMMQMQADACQNQMQILGVMTRLICQLYGSANEALGGGLATLPPQVLQSLQHPAELGDTDKPESNSPSEFM